MASNEQKSSSLRRLGAFFAISCRQFAYSMTDFDDSSGFFVSPVGVIQPDGGIREDRNIASAFVQHVWLLS